MNRILIYLLCSWLFIGITWAQTRTPLAHSPRRIIRAEPQSFEPSHSSRRPYNISSHYRWGAEFTLVDSSMNGYGLIRPSTRPLLISDEGWFMAYRQWNGPTGGSGQLGAAYLEDGTDWTIYTNLNPGLGTARYPSALAIEEYPYVFWNELENIGGQTFGRPYYSYDEFGWDGGSFSVPVDVDFLWNQDNYWVLSPDVSFDAADDMYYFNIAVSDWSSSDIYSYHSEAYDDGFIIFGENQILMDLPEGDPEEAMDYTSDPTLFINEAGVGYCAVSTYDTLNSLHTLLFVKTDNYGVSWHGPTDSTYYKIPQSVIDHMLSSGDFPNSYHNPCDGEDTSNDLNFEQLFMVYDFDLKVDDAGNPHFVVGVMGTANSLVYPGLPNSGLYYFTIDQEYLDDPGEPMSDTGWFYSRITSMEKYWSWKNESSDPYWQIVFPQLIFDIEHPSYLVVAFSGPNPGLGVAVDNNGTPGYSCDDLFLYPTWNEDVFVFRSENSGDDWIGECNITNTAPDCWVSEIGSIECSEEFYCEDGITRMRTDEVSVHTGSYAEDEVVPLLFQVPDLCQGMQGELTAADRKSLLFVGTADVDGWP